MTLKSFVGRGVIGCARAACRQSFWQAMPVVALVVIALVASSSSVVAQSLKPCPPKASDGSQATSELDADEECAPADATAPDQPTLIVSQAFGAVVLHWNHFAGNEYGYEVYRDGLSYHSATAGQTVFVDRRAIDGESHNYAIWPVIIESDQIQSTIPSEFVYVKNSAWSTLDPADALRTANAQTIVTEMKDIAPEHRPVVMAAIAGTNLQSETADINVDADVQSDAESAEQPASVDGTDEAETAVAETDASEEAGAESSFEAEPAIDILSLVESILSASTFVDQHTSTLLLNRFLRQQGSERQLSSVFDLDDFDPNSNFQHRLSVDTFSDIRDSLLVLDFGQLEAESVNQSVVESIVTILDLAESRGLAGTTAVSPLSGESQTEVAEGDQAEPLNAVGVEQEPSTTETATDAVETAESEQPAGQMLLIDKDGNIRVDRTPASNTVAGSNEPASPTSRRESMQQQMNSIGQRMILIGKSSQSSEPDLDTSDNGTLETLQLDQGQTTQAASNEESGSIEILDLSVEPGQGFETLPLNQPIPSGEGDLLDLGSGANSQNIETLPIQTSQ